MRYTPLNSESGENIVGLVSRHPMEYRGAELLSGRFGYMPNPTVAAIGIWIRIWIRLLRSTLMDNVKQQAPAGKRSAWP